MFSLSDLIVVAIALIIITSGSRQIFNILIRGHAPFIFSRRRPLKIITETLILKPHETVYELGAGTAPLLRRLAKRYPDNQFTAIEYAFIPYVCGRLLTWHRPNISWRKDNLYQTDLSQADYLYCFLNVPTMRQLENKLLSNCKNNAVIISYIFTLPHCPDDKIITVGAEKIHFYKIARIDKDDKMPYK